MADLSKIKLNGNTYNIKDAEARPLVVTAEWAGLDLEYDWDMGGTCFIIHSQLDNFIDALINHKRIIINFQNNTGENLVFKNYEILNNKNLLIGKQLELIIQDISGIQYFVSEENINLNAYLLDNDCDILFSINISKTYNNTTNELEDIILEFGYHPIEVEFPEYEITTATPNAVGTAVVGEAETDIPNYTPSGDINYDTNTINIETPNNISLSYIYSNYKLYFYNPNTTKNKYNISIPTNITFDGNGVQFAIQQKEEEEESP